MPRKVPDDFPPSECPASGRKVKWASACGQGEHVYLLECCCFLSTSCCAVSSPLSSGVRAGKGLQEATSSVPHFASGSKARTSLGQAPGAVLALGVEKPFLFTMPTLRALCPLVPLFFWLMEVLYKMSLPITLACFCLQPCPCPIQILRFIFPQH